MNNELQLQIGPYRTTYVGTEILRESTSEEWQVYGEILRRVDEVKQWAIGDWLVDGKRHYGDKLYEKAALILNVEKNILEHYKSQSERFELCLRKQNLSWSHHKEVASLKPVIENKKTGKLKLSNKETDHKKITEMLLNAEKEELSVRDLRNKVSAYKRRQDSEIRLANEPEKYDIILADPAWQYDFSVSDSRNIDNQYAPSSMDDMKRLRVPAAEDCVLFMWGTSPKLREAFALIDAWGFEYKTCGVWVKDKIGMGYYFRQQHELILIATKGDLQLPDEDIRPSSVFKAPRTEHSEKPNCIYEAIETMYPNYKKLEMFGRGAARSDWDIWGDESNDS